MKKLNKDKADALCSIVLLGYCKAQSNATFVYSDPKDKNKYEEVLSVFDKLGVTIKVKESTPKTTNAVIIAETSRTRYYEQKEIITQIENSLNSKLEKLTNESHYGAYIGGYSDISKVVLIGSSGVEMYEPQFRDAGQEIEKSYTGAVKVSNGVRKIIKDYLNGGFKVINGVKVWAEPIAEINKSYDSGNLFKSIHGMVASMILYASTMDNNAFEFELAFSKGTTKVASCFPCCAFMTAQGKPPSATHLGRGDNWNFPKADTTNVIRLKNKWISSINDWYDKGIKVLEQSGKTTPWNKDDFKSEKIHEVFLEALTFEGPFTEKVIQSLGNSKKLPESIM